MDLISLTGNRVLIKLDHVESKPKDDSGIIVPLFEQAETDGGRPDFKVSNRQYLPKGEIVAISPAASKMYQEEGTPLVPGDRVYVSIAALSNAFHFYPERDNLVIPFDGHVLLQPNLIEAHVNN